jgi:hypothetical protein
MPTKKNTPKFNENYICIKDLSKENYEKWKKFLKEKDKNYSQVEGIWRRTQKKENKKDSNWKSKKDKRRKILHYINRYTCEKNKKKINLTLKETYLWISLTFPKKEIQKYFTNIENSLKKGNWQKEGENFYSLGKYIFEIKHFQKHPEDILENRKFNKNYESLELIFKTKGMKIKKQIRNQPWIVLKSGLRKKDTRKNPKILTNLKDLKKHFPAQIIIGCGPSIECGIPPLHFLHEIYKISNPLTKKFTLNPKEDTIIYEILQNPFKFFKRSTKMYKKIILSKPNISYKIIKKLFDEKKFVGKILTNNFDKIPKTLGLKEKYLRRYDETHIIPKIKFDKKAKSLIVIGVHADRRKIQKAARKKGLKIIYIDPEGYNIKGKWIKYPLESAQNKDLLISLKAKKVLPKLLKI